ncbi:hypothetical protein SAMN05421505_10625 [Sinosporangium album]|uniref:Uncharacterized protein n=1 Tax=Sinosporangium album TaxID=504805 RepID=A0A1G7VSK8_9ACTN|nr:hypothetical protein SAMN05421505_10625 [Sinosporangium album]
MVGPRWGPLWVPSAMCAPPCSLPCSSRTACARFADSRGPRVPEAWFRRPGPAEGWFRGRMPVVLRVGLGGRRALAGPGSSCAVRVCSRYGCRRTVSSRTRGVSGIFAPPYNANGENPAKAAGRGPVRRCGDGSGPVVGRWRLGGLWARRRSLARPPGAAPVSLPQAPIQGHHDPIGPWAVRRTQREIDQLRACGSLEHVECVHFRAYATDPVPDRPRAEQVSGAFAGEVPFGPAVGCAQPRVDGRKGAGPRRRSADSRARTARAIVWSSSTTRTWRRPAVTGEALEASVQIISGKMCTYRAEADSGPAHPDKGYG